MAWSIRNLNLKQMLNSKLFIAYFVVISLQIYFLYHILSGRNSIFTYYNLQKIEHDKREDLSKLKAKNVLYISELGLLNKKVIDLDYLEGVAKEKLNYLNDQEVIILIDNVVPSPQ